MTLLEDIVTYLTNLGLVVGDGEDAYRDFKPESPDNIVSLHEYAGDPASPFTEVVHRSVQVVVRDQSADAAREKARLLAAAFADVGETRRIDFTATRWGQVYLRQPPFKLSQDEQNRTHYCFNLGITTTME